MPLWSAVDVRIEGVCTSDPWSPALSGWGLLLKQVRTWATSRMLPDCLALTSRTWVLSGTAGFQLQKELGSEGNPPLQQGQWGPCPALSTPLTTPSRFSPAVRTQANPGHHLGWVNMVLQVWGSFLALAPTAILKASLSSQSSCLKQRNLWRGWGYTQN